MKTSKYKIPSILLVTCYLSAQAGLLLITFNIANAAGIVPCNGTDCTVCHLFLGIKNIVNFLSFKIAMPMAAIVLMYGGIMMLTSGGSETKVSKGKDALKYAVFGLLVTFGAWLIVDTILGNLISKGYLPWNQFPGC